MAEPLDKKRRPDLALKLGILILDRSACSRLRATFTNLVLGSIRSRYQCSNFAHCDACATDPGSSETFWPEKAKQANAHTIPPMTPRRTVIRPMVTDARNASLLEAPRISSATIMPPSRTPATNRYWQCGSQENHRDSNERCPSLNLADAALSSRSTPSRRQARMRRCAFRICRFASSSWFRRANRQFRVSLHMRSFRWSAITSNSVSSPSRAVAETQSDRGCVSFPAKAS